MFEGAPVMRKPAFCHKAVRQVAQVAAGELYESLMSDNRLYEVWQKSNPGLTGKALESRFIAKNWGKCIEFACATMALMLRRPDISESVKAEIFEALKLDASIPIGRMAPGRAESLREGFIKDV